MMRWPFSRKNPTLTLQPVATKEPAALDADPGGGDIANDWLKQMALLTGDVERPGEAPGWALMLRSPYQSWERATSWLGGVPCAPDDFVWPRGGDGVPLHFFAQIDLAEVRSEPGICARPAGLLPSGALLVFIGLKEHAAVTLTHAEMADASPLSLPADLPPIRDIGHWKDTTTFDTWPVDIVPFLDNGAYRPAAFPDPWSSPVNWISTWAIAQAEADIVLAEIDSTRRQAVRFRRKKQVVATADDSSKARRAAAAKEQQSFYFRKIGGPEFRKFHATMIAWRDAATKGDPEAPVDTLALDGLFILRRRQAENMPNQMLKLLLSGRHQSVWDNISRHHGAAIAERQFHAIPAGLRPFVDAVITDWRGHKVFGLVKDLWHNSDDRRGQDVLITVHSDELLATQMEHDHAISVWCARDGMADGRYAKGRVVRHNNG
jgi:Domain of unknown function (DUF1963)